MAAELEISRPLEGGPGASKVAMVLFSGPGWGQDVRWSLISTVTDIAGRGCAFAAPAEPPRARRRNHVARIGSGMQSAWHAQAPRVPNLHHDEPRSPDVPT